MAIRRILLQALSLVSSLTPVMLLYSGVGVLANTQSPVVVVLSGSMEPAFQRGDILFMTNPPHQQYRTGDIVVYKVPGAEIPIVHRVVQARDIVQQQENTEEDVRLPADGDVKWFMQPEVKAVSWRSEDRENGKSVRDQLILTKGDNNDVDDVGLYIGFDRLQRKHIVGKVRGFLPYVGYASIVMNEMPRVKYAFFAALGLASLF
ncbi:hypothetical protein CVT25_001205 [Psilocybe cyanescens]|uniref:Signal peptidase complex catalytic subunit SEC11 n=1 Tax=Psilocybe cyanescens TaxID=93625 RepID=A0A409XKA2_PSICY|nr:hypothetical protein CVT25_001205 [Psilocybe cyanescens]